MSFAKTTLAGTVAQTPEKRFTAGNNLPVTSFEIIVPSPAMGAKGNPGETFTVRVHCWRGLADTVAEQVRAGEAVVVEGKLQMYSYQTPEGIQRKGFEIEANSLYKLPGGMPQAVLAAPGAAAVYGQGQQPAAPASPYATSPSGFAPPPPQQGAPQQQPQPVAAAATPAPFITDDFITEDDIPF